MFKLFQNNNVEELPKLRPEIKKIYDYVKFHIDLFALKIEGKSFSIIPKDIFVEKRVLKYISVFNNSLNIEETGKVFAISNWESSLFYNLAKENLDKRIADEYVKRYEELKRFSERLNLK